MESRCRILEAAARIYGELGFRGATTRRIAEAAGVNEITLFRHFGSKAALIDEAVRSHSRAPSPALPPLPEVPADPESELTAWATAHLAHLRASRSLIRKTMGELEERRDFAPCIAENPTAAGAALKIYITALCVHGFIPKATRGPSGRDEALYAGGAMLMAALFADAMGRDMMPDLYPQPVERAPALYVQLFLHALGARVPARQAVRTAGARPIAKRGAAAGEKIIRPTHTIAP
jgi:AcrR family transcriptional regulator